MEKIILIDGHSILNRAFYGIPDLTNSKGIHTNAVYGFLNIMFKIMDEEKADYLAVAFDLSAPTFRHKMFEAYKGTRKKMPDELHEQVPVMKEVLSAMNIPVLTKEGFEADDILGTISKRCEQQGLKVSVVSGDRDLLQLATDKIMIRIPKTKKGQTEVENYNASDVVDKYQVTPTEFIDLKALMGDTSDNIPGVPGIGEKTATNIIVQFKNIENAHEHLDEITPNKAKQNLGDYYDQAVLSKTLATIDTDAPIEFKLEDARIGDMFTKEAYELFKTLELKTILKKFDDITEVGSFEAEKHYCEIEDFGKADEFLNKCMRSKTLGLYLVPDDKGIMGVAAVMDTDGIMPYIPCQGLITQEYLISRIEEIVRTAKNRNGVCSFLDLKSQLDYFKADINDNVVDLGLAAYLLNPLKNTYLYDDIARDYVGINIPSQSDLLGKMNYVKAYESSKDNFLKAVLNNAYTAYAAAERVISDVDKEGMGKLYREIELPMVFVLRSMENYGIRADRNGLKEYGNRLSVRIDELEKSITELAGMSFNINSPKQLGEVLFEKLQLPNGKKTKTGYSTSADVLEKLADKHEIIPQILEYRQLTKLKSTYADGLIDYIREDGRIHGTFNQTITATGRISSTEPNLQNIPIRMELGRQIRKVFVPEDGYVFLDADYSQIELRILAAMSGDENLIKAYNEESDIHRITASQVFHTPLAEVTPQQRSNAKAVNFGIVYGISSFGLSQGLSISRKEASQYIEKYFETYPGVKQFLENLVNTAKEEGAVRTIFGRKRPIPEISSSNFMQRQFGERIAMNSPVQGTAADIIKIAMIGVYNRLKEAGLKSRMILQIHDELLIETSKGEIEQVKKILSEEMHNAVKLPVPLEIDMHEGTDWFEAKA